MHKTNLEKADSKSTISIHTDQEILADNTSSLNSNINNINNNHINKNIKREWKSKSSILCI